MQTNLEKSGDDHFWQQLAPHLEAAMSRLGAADRTLLALRYYENKTGAEAAAVLGIREETARKRTNRALEKLRKVFANRGVVSTTTIIAGAISANSVHAAPTGLTQTISAVAVAKGATASASTLTLAHGALKLMAWTKTKTTIVGVAIALLSIGGTTMVVNTLLPVPDIQGTWEGMASMPNAGVHAGESAQDPAVMRISRVNGVYQVKCDDIGMGQHDIAIDEFTYRYPFLHGEITWANRSFAGKVDRSGNEITWTDLLLREKQVLATGVLWRTNNPTPIPEPLTEAEFAPRAGSALQGFWAGTFGLVKPALHIQVKIAEAFDGTFRADLYDPYGFTNRQPTAVTYDGTTVKLVPMDGLGMFEGQLTNGNSEMTGDWIQNGYHMPTTLTKADYSEYQTRDTKK